MTKRSYSKKLLKQSLKATNRKSQDSNRSCKSSCFNIVVGSLALTAFMVYLFTVAANNGSSGVGRSTNTPRATFQSQSINPVQPTAQPSSQPTQQLYAQSSTNARSCPQLDCDIYTVVGSGEDVTVIDEVEGESVNDNDQWYKVIVNNRSAYIHSSMLSESRPVIVQATLPSNSLAPPDTSASSVRPGSCPTARAMGLSAVEAAQWSHLDRDNDGVACYDD